MAVWDKGDPYPEDWPQWLREADILWCEVEIQPSGVLWRDGTWNNGIWVSGEWLGGTWGGGVWKSGTWYDGIWYSGVWRSGTWLSGIWIDGIWDTGYCRAPKFGWSLWVTPGSIRGYVTGPSAGFRVLTFKEWEPHLQSMPPEKVLEFRLLVEWFTENTRFSLREGPVTSVWDHLAE